MPEYKITRGKLVTGRGKDKKSYTIGDKVKLTPEQAKAHGMDSLERIEQPTQQKQGGQQKASADVTTNPQKQESKG